MYSSMAGRPKICMQTSKHDMFYLLLCVPPTTCQFVQSIHAVAARHHCIAEKLRRDTRALPRRPATWCRLRLCAHQVAGMRECGKLSGRQQLDSWVAHVLHPQCNAAAMSVEPHTWPLHRTAHHHPQCQPRAQKYPKGAREHIVHRELRRWPKI